VREAAPFPVAGGAAQLGGHSRTQMHRPAARRGPELPFSAGIRAAKMERLWSLAVATSGSRWQMQEARKPLKQAETVAVGCDQLPIGAHGKEGVDGSSPSEGLHKNPANGSFCCLRRRSAGVSRVRDGYVFGRAGTRRQARFQATTVKTCRFRSQRQKCLQTSRLRCRCWRRGDHLLR
jgi:hypothetical protein